MQLHHKHSGGLVKIVQGLEKGVTVHDYTIMDGLNHLVFVLLRSVFKQCRDDSVKRSSKMGKIFLS